MCLCLCFCVSVSHSVVSDCDPVDSSPPGSSVHGILQARVLEWVAFLNPGIFLTQGSSLGFLHGRCLRVCLGMPMSCVLTHTCQCV